MACCNRIINIREESLQFKNVLNDFGVAIRDDCLLNQALTHPSYINENPDNPVESYQRLEFLGDAVVGLVTALELHQSRKDMNEGELTKMRAHLVQEKTLANVASRLDMGSYLRLGKGEATSGGRSRDSNLSAAFESLVGAIFLDQGFDISRKFILQCLEHEIRDVLDFGIPTDPKVELQELVQSVYGESPIYKISDGIKSHDADFVIEVYVDGKMLGTGNGQRMVDAEREAASLALNEIRKT